MTSFNPDRFTTYGINDLMTAVVTTGNGGYDKLVYRDVPRPKPGPGEVLLKVLAAGVNNTEINTRLGWYSSSVTGDTETTAQTQEEAATQKSDGGWNEATPFPLIQGTDCCGEVVHPGPNTETYDPGTRVIVRACMRTNGFSSLENIWMASDFDGAFAQFVTVPATEIFPVKCTWTHEELATIPCAYGTAENMVHRTNVSEHDHVLVPGASGGVGSAIVQLCKRRGATITAIASGAKMDTVKALGADRVLERNADLISVLGEKSVDVVIDNVAGGGFPGLLKVMKRGGRYASSGAIAGPIVNLDMRDFYLKDLTLIGCTAWDEPVFPNLIGYIERGEIRPLVAQSFPLDQIADTQRAFLEKKHVGNFVLIPPGV